MEKRPGTIIKFSQRKLKYPGHIMRGPNYEIHRDILQGKIPGKKAERRSRHFWTKDFRK